LITSLKVNTQLSVGGGVPISHVQ